MRPTPLLAAALTAVLATACGWPAPAPDAMAGMAGVDTSIVVRRVAETAPFAIFPDGSRLVVVDSIGNLMVEDVATRERRPLTTDGSWEESRWPELAVVSPGGERVAYSWYDNDSIRVRVVGADGRGERSLLGQRASEGWLTVADWTPDGSALFVLAHGGPGGDRLLLLDAGRGDVSEVYDFGWRRPYLPGLSPDGRFIAVTLQTSDETSSRDLYTLELATGELLSVVDLEESVRLADWAPDGDALFFVTERDGIVTLWRQPVSAGAASGAPERVRGDLARFQPVGYAGNGLYFNVFHRYYSIRHAQLTAGSEAVAVPPATLVERVNEFVTGLEWSPDAQHLAYVPAGPFAERRLVVRSRASGEERVFAPALQLENGVEWQADGLFVAGRREGTSWLHAVDFGEGRLRPVEDLGQLRAVSLPRITPDGGKRVFVRAGEQAGDLRQMVVQDLSTGSERVLLEEETLGTMGISPDGRHVALIRRFENERLVVLSMESGESRVIYEAPGESWLKGGSIAWTPDSRAVLVLEQHVTGPREANSIFRRVALDGTVSTLLNAGGPGAAIAFGLSADGRHLAYTSGSEEEPRSELWVVEGLER